MVSIELPILLAQVGTFLAALWVVWRFGWGPLVKLMKDRQEAIRKSVEGAEEARATMARMEQEYQLKMQEIERRASELVALARAEGTRVREEMVKSAQAEADATRRKAREQLDVERRELARDIRQEIVTLSMAVAGKAAGQIVDSDTHRKRFESILSEIESTKPGVAS